MNKAQKIAWFNLVTIIAGFGFGFTLVAVEMFKLAVILFLSAGALITISPQLFREKRGRIDFDERDQSIRLRALFFASFSSFWFLIIQCVLQVFKVGPRGSVPVGTLVGTVSGALFAFVTAKSLWTLYEYRHGKK
ncbi:MAG: hypothetical protein JXB29_08065 [Sedimentisphaerales bacterium]|nr:hypothetical protein [Sedimentisphaerales bacterium]